jgi:hypothetical protein
MSEALPVPLPARALVRQTWIERLERFAAARLSVIAFCRQEGVSVQAFYYWRHKLAPDHTQTQPTDGPRLLPVHIRVPSAAPVEVVLPSGAVLRLAAGCDLAFIRSLVAALGDPPC